MWLWSWRSILRLWSNMRSAPEERSSEIVKRLPAGPCSMVEVGTWRGIMAEMVLMKHREVTLITVDNWAGAETQPAAYRATGDFHAKLTLAQQAQFKTETERKLKRFGARAVILAMDSVEAAEEVADGSMDGVFIDADHSQAGVERDIATWKWKVRPGGWLGFHDYRHPEPRFKFGVTEAVDAFAVRVGKEVQQGANLTAFVYL